MALQHLRASTADKRPTPAAMADGQLAMNTNLASPGLFFKDSNGDLVKTGPVHVGTTAPNATPASGGQTGNSKGELWLDTTGTDYTLKTWDGTAWREIVVTSTMIKDGTIVNADVNASAAIAGTKVAPDFGSQNVVTTGTATAASLNPTGSSVPTNGVYLPAANSVAISTNGSERLTVGTTAVSSTLAVDHPLGAVGTPSITFTGDLNTGFWSPSADAIAASTGGSERLRIDSSGRLGLGTSSPAFALDISAPNDTIVRSRTNGNTSAGFIGSTNNGTNNWFIGSRKDSTGGTSGTDRFNLLYDTNAFLTVSTAGAVGIGTTAPTEALTIAAGATDRVGASVSGTVATIFLGNSNNATSCSSISYDRADGGLTFNNGSTGSITERARIDSSGRLLVGTSTALLLGSALANYALNIETLVGVGVLNHAIGATRHGGTTPEAGQVLTLARSRGTSIGSVTLVANNDLLGSLDFAGADGTDFGTTAASVNAYVDGTPGANDMPGRLVFSTTADGASSPTERMRIDSAGEISMGSGSINFLKALTLTTGQIGTSSGTLTVGTANNNTNGRYIEFQASGAVAIGSITQSSASAVAYNTSSDYRLKENVEPITDGITRLLQLKPSRFNFIIEPEHTIDGFLAHEVQDFVPEAIAGEKDEVDADGNPVYQGIDQSKLVPLLTAALQETIAELQALKAEVAALKAS